MNGFILRVTAHHGEPQLVGNVFVRPGISHDFPIAKTQIVNDPNNEQVFFVADVGAVPMDYPLDQLINDFQEEYGCKVSYSPDEPGQLDEMPVFEFDMFEPSWPTQEEAEDVITDLSDRLKDWVNGYPMGR